MKLRADQLRLKGLLKETITLLCKNGLQFSKGLVIDALIGITTDDASTFLLKLEETVGYAGKDDNTEAENVNGSIIRRERSRATRKRPLDGDTRITRSKRHRSNQQKPDKSADNQSNGMKNDPSLQDGDIAKNDTDNVCYDYECDNNDSDDCDNDCVNLANDRQDEQNDNDGDDTIDGDQNKQDSDELMIVKPELCDSEGHVVQADRADDTAPDGGSSDGLPTWNQSSASNDPDASGPQQVCFRFCNSACLFVAYPNTATCISITPKSRFE